MTTTDAKIQPDAGRQGTIFCIDCGDYMFEVNENDEQKLTHMLIALKAMRSEMNLKCLSADLREMVGVIFFNTAKTNIDAEGLDNIFVYRNIVEYDEEKDMKGMGADLVKQIDELIKNEEIRKEFFEKTLGGSGECNYSQLIWLIQRNFQYDAKAQKKNAIVFSRNQFMSDYNEALMEKVKLQLEEADLAGISVKHMILGEEELAEHWESLESEIEIYNNLDSLTDGIKRKNVSRRATTTIPLHFGTGLSLAVSIFHPIVEQKLKTEVWLDAKSMALVKSKTKYVKQPTISDTMSLSRIIGDEESGGGSVSTQKREEVDYKKIKLSRRIGGMNIEMDKAEYENFKRIDDPGIHIIGFKPMHYLKQSHQVGKTEYLFPNEALVNGSTCLYRALFNRCLAKDVFILARFILKRNTSPRLVALVPQRKGDPKAHETDVENHFYEGFHVVHLPFADDKRNLQSKLEGDWPTPTDEQVKAAESFINKLTAPYNPEKFSNPVLQKHYWVLEALATENDDMGEDFEFDQIKPYFVQPGQSNRAKNEAKNFENQLP